MDTTTFVATVRESGRFETDANAREATAATLEAFGDCIARGQAEDIAAQLPDDLAEPLLAGATEEAQPLEYDDFLSQVSEQAGFPREYAQARVQAVVAALKQAIDEFEFENLRRTLPRRYGPIFEAVGERSLVETVAAETDLAEETAGRAVRATLETLGERLSLGEAEDLAAYLSEEESTWLIDPDSPAAVGFPPEEFVERTAEREGVDLETARDHIQQVVEGIEALAHAELQRARDQLGPDYSSLI